MFTPWAIRFGIVGELLTGCCGHVVSGGLPNPAYALRFRDVAPMAAAIEGGDGLPLAGHQQWTTLRIQLSKSITHRISADESRSI